MSQSPRRKSFTFGGPAVYRIIVQGHLDETMADRLGGMSVEATNEGAQGPVTTLTGHLRDQAELNGVLNTIYNLHLAVLSVQCVSGPEGPEDNTET
jgi:hypothetical protein